MLINCHSHYSFKYGTCSVTELLEQAQELGYRSLALTDINNTSACLELLREAYKYQIRPVLGIDFREQHQQRYIGIAINNAGFAELNRFLSFHLKSQKPLPERAPIFDNAYIIYPWKGENPFALHDHEYLGIKASQLSRLSFSPWLKQKEKLLMLPTVTFASKRGYSAHRLLRAMDLNTLLSKLPPAQQASAEDLLLPAAELLEQFEAFPFLPHNTQRLMDDCHVNFNFKSSKNKKYYFDSAKKDLEKLKQLCAEGAHWRYGTLSEPIVQRIEKEIEIIAQKGFVSYFLINWDIVRYARSRGFFYVGRGSGANSVVAYCLRITDVDPIELDLYFERFINLYRESPPDFDLDFSWKDRDEVIAYILSKYGEEHACQLAAYNTFQVNSVMRELGKVFGLPKADIEQLIAQYGQQAAPHQLGKMVYHYAEFLKDRPSHLSIHAGGILIAEKSIYEYTATQIPPKGFPISQFDMMIAEDIGLHKFDILSQRGLGHIKEVVEIVKENQDINIDIHDIRRFKQDERIKELLRTGHTMGCFYVESPAMRMLLAKLQADTYLDLVAASSIIRPGVARSGMMREFILRHRSEEARKSIHPIMGDIMPDTYGVMVYQEDVIKVAHYFAGLSLAEADVLRRGMSGKYRSRQEFQKVEEKFFANCKQKGHPESLTKEIWYQIESFAGYSFAKGHSASFAVESYQSLFLKAYFPLEFMVGVINNFGGFYQTEFYLHEARMCGAIVHAPCVNTSRYHTRIIGQHIFLGLIHLARLEEKVVRHILAERENGPYQGLEDFLERTSASLEQTLILIRIDAFRFSGKAKQQLLWEAHFLCNKQKEKNPQPSLFKIKRLGDFRLPPLQADSRDDVLDQLELLGFPLASPFLLLKHQLEIPLRATDMPHNLGRRIELMGYLVTAKPTRTVKGDRMYFGTFLDEDGNWIDTIHFPPVARRYPFRGKGCYLLRGKVTEEFGYYSLEIDEMHRLAYWNRDDAPHKQLASGGLRMIS